MIAVKLILVRMRNAVYARMRSVAPGYGYPDIWMGAAARHGDKAVN